jgi:UDP-glucose 4-epimerase
MGNLVTGGAGFIGSHLVDRLLADGQGVTVLDNYATGRAVNLAHLDGHPQLRVVHGSVLDESLVAELMVDTTQVYHLAAAVGVGHVVRDPLGAILTNVQGTEVILKQAHARQVPVLFASTSEIYGESETIPFREDGPRVLGPTWVHRWGYSTAKALDEHLCFAYAARGLGMSIVRYFNIYGPRLDPAGYGSVIARFIQQARAGEPLTVHGDGQQQRCFTYVTEAVEATVRAATLPSAAGQVFNVGSHFETSIQSLAEQIAARVDSAGRIQLVPYEVAYGPGFADPRRRVPDITAARERLGWQATIDLAAGLDRLLALGEPVA